MTAPAEGWVCAHTHLYSGLAPLGMPAPETAPASFPERLERVWWRLDRALDHESIAAAARLYVAEALLAGTTALFDHHESPGCIEGSLDVLADACEELGMPALLCYGVSERNGGREEARRGLEECARFERANERALVRGAVGVHAGFTVSDATLVEAAELARELGVALHLHLAEDESDARRARELGHAGAAQRLLALDALPPNSLLAHGVHLSEDEVRALDARGASFIQNPRSNVVNRVGTPLALHAATRVALGTDGFPAHMPTEALALGPGEHALGGERLRASAALARELLGAAWSVEHSPARTLVAGRPVVQDGQLVQADLEEIRAQASAHAPRLWARMQAL